MPTFSLRRTAVAAALLAIAASASAQAPALHAQVPPLVNGMYASLDAL